MDGCRCAAVLPPPSRWRYIDTHADQNEASTKQLNAVGHRSHRLRVIEVVIKPGPGEHQNVPS